MQPLDLLGSQARRSWAINRDVIVCYDLSKCASITDRSHRDRGSITTRSWNSSMNLPSCPIAYRGELDGSDCVHQCLDAPLPRHRLLCPFDEDQTLSKASTRRPVIAEIVIDGDRPMRIAHPMKIGRSGSLHISQVMCRNHDGSRPSNGD